MNTAIATNRSAEVDTCFEMFGPLPFGSLRAPDFHIAKLWAGVGNCIRVPLQLAPQLPGISPSAAAAPTERERLHQATSRPRCGWISGGKVEQVDPG